MSAPRRFRKVVEWNWGPGSEAKSLLIIGFLALAVSAFMSLLFSFFGSPFSRAEAGDWMIICGALWVAAIAAARVNADVKYVEVVEDR